MKKKGLGICACTQDTIIVDLIKRKLAAENCHVVEMKDLTRLNDDIVWLVFLSPAGIVDEEWNEQLSILAESKAPMISVILKWADLPSKIQILLAGKTTHIQSNKTADSFIQWLKRNEKTKECFPQCDMICVKDLEYTGPYYLFHNKTGKRVRLSVGDYRIGSKNETCDWTLIGCPGVSRLHATVTMKDQECYIRDEYSTNGTYVNERRIPPGEPTRIFIGDEILLFREKFILQKEE